MKATTPRIVLIRRPTLYVAALGALAFATTVACSDDPVSQLGVAGTSPGVAGTTPGTAGTTAQPIAGTGGAPVGTAGTGFGNAGTPATGGTGTAGTATGGTGTGGTGTGGTGTAGSGTAGTGGVYVPPPPFCQGKTPDALPFTVTTAFYASAWQGLYSQITATSATDYCATRAPGAVGGCSRWTVTPDLTAPAWTAVAWSNRADANFTHDPTCLATGAKRIAFLARGAVGGEELSCGGAGLPSTSEVKITLTTEWKEYSIPLPANHDYNNAMEGMTGAFSWKVEPMLGDTPTVFAIDSIRIVATDAPGGGGSGGAGGTGGSGGAGGSGGTGGSSTGGTGGASGGTGGTSGGTGGTNN